MDQRTCVVLRFRGDRISELRDYTDAGLYQRFLDRHRSELPKFTPR
jgi:ketosteroid isomerase-like protein